MKILLSGVLIFFTLISCTDGMNEQSDMADEPSIKGAWEIVEAEYTDADTSGVWSPYKSIYMFTDKYYSIEIANDDRASVPQLAEGEEYDPSVIVESGEGFISNSGTYEVVGDSLIYHVKVSKWPNRMNRDQRVSIHMTLEGDRMILSDSIGSGNQKMTLRRLD